MVSSELSINDVMFIFINWKMNVICDLDYLLKVPSYAHMKHTRQTKAKQIYQQQKKLILEIDIDLTKSI